MAKELFELELLGGATERRYRKQRPEVEEMPWGTIDIDGFDPAVLLAARKAWTGAAFQEHRTGIACALALKALMEARAPLDLVAQATRFPLDELVHVELTSRMAMELGGATEIIHDPDRLVVKPLEGVDPLLRAGDLVVRFFCVGEALSIPMLRGAWKHAEHPLPKAVLGRIVRDEAAHGTFGWTFLDWALPHYSESDLAVLARSADETIERVLHNWEEIRSRPRKTHPQIHALGWMESDDYLELANRSLERNVIRPLLRRGIPIQSKPLAKAGRLYDTDAAVGLFASNDPPSP